MTDTSYLASKERYQAFHGSFIECCGVFWSQKATVYETATLASFLSPQTQVEIQRGCSRAAQTLPFLNVYPMADRFYPLRDRGNNRSVSNQPCSTYRCHGGPSQGRLCRPMAPQISPMRNWIKTIYLSQVRDSAEILPFTKRAIGSKLTKCPKCANWEKAHLSALGNRIKTRDMSGMRTRVSGPTLLNCAKR